MKILILSMTFPYPLVSGGKIRVFNLIKHLSKRHSIYLLSFIDSKDDLNHIEKIKPYCKKIETVVLLPGIFFFLSRLLRGSEVFLKGMPLVVINKRSCKMIEMVKEILKRETFDCVQFEWLQMAQYVPRVCTHSRFIISES